MQNEIEHKAGSLPNPAMSRTPIYDLEDENGRDLLTLNTM